MQPFFFFFKLFSLFCTIYNSLDHFTATKNVGLVEYLFNKIEQADVGFPRKCRLKELFKSYILNDNCCMLTQNNS